jgi:ferritin-like metal-binding protein YciE
MGELTTLKDAFVDEIKDLYDAEKQLIRALPKMVKAAGSSDLQSAIGAHLEETRGHVDRLEKVFEFFDMKPKGVHCAGIAGIIEEGAESLEEDAEEAVMDACIIASGQRAEHYEIAAYGTAVAWAEALDLTEVAGLLTETLNEEKAADRKLSDLAEAGINAAATAGRDQLPDESVRARGKQPPRASGSARQHART